MSAIRLRLGEFRKGAPVWIPAFAVQLAILIFFIRSFWWIVSGHRVWGVSDDIYISACYGRTLAAGHGLLWWPGALHVEGITNPFWVFALAAVRFLPFFRETTLGADVFLMNFFILAAIWALIAATIRSYLAAAGEFPPGFQTAIVLSLMAAAAATLPYWMSEGFESGLVILLMFGGYKIAANPMLEDRDGLALGLLTGLAFWTRMDGVLCMIGPWLLALPALLRRRSALASLLLSSAAMAAALFILRRLYYGDWLPNTYYLKIEGWPLRDRLRAGWKQNWIETPALFACWGLAAIPWLRRRMGAALRPFLTTLLTATILVAYSIHNGGDSWLAKMGHDRFTVAGTMVLAFGLALAVGAIARGDWKTTAVSALIAAGILASPALLDKGALPLIRRTAKQDVPRREPSWVRYGMAFEKVSKPGATIAISPAGAIIYFSHRGGVDLLGKNDPIPARQPVNVRDGLPGHNKRYEGEVMEARRPDFAREAPPDSIAPDYRRMRTGGNHFWVRKDSPYVVWDRLTPEQ